MRTFSAIFGRALMMMSRGQRLRMAARLSSICSGAGRRAGAAATGVGVCGVAEGGVGRIGNAGDFWGVVGVVGEGVGAEAGGWDRLDGAASGGRAGRFISAGMAPAGTGTWM